MKQGVFPIMARVFDIASTEGLRHRNRGLVLETLRLSGPLSHTEIAILSGLAPGTVTAISTELKAEGVVLRHDQPPASGRGRPRSLFELRADFAHFVFVRISSGVVELSLVDFRGVLMDRVSAPRDISAGAEGFTDDFKARVERFLSRSKLDLGQIHAISITTKGIVDPDAKTLLWSPAFDSEKINFEALLAPDFDGELRLANETGFTAYDQMARAEADETKKPPRRVAVVSLGDSIGLGIASRATGQHSSGVELVSPAFGHMQHQAQGPLCRCGSRGCLETYAGFYGILRAAFDAPEGVIPAKFIPIEQMQRLAQQARQGSKPTAYAFRQAGEALGASVSRMFSIFGVMPVAIAGPGREFFDLMQQGFMHAVNENLLLRHGQVLDIGFVQNEPERVFDSAVAVTLQRFNNTKVATRKVTGKPAKGD